MKKLLSRLGTNGKDNLTTLIGSLMSAAFGVLTFMLLSRSLSKQEFGTYAIFMSVAGLADMIRTGFVRQGLVQLVQVSDTGRKSAILGSAWILHVGIVFTTGIFIFALGTLIQSDFWNLFSRYFPLLLVSSFGHQMVSWIAQAFKNYGRINFYRLWVNVGQLLLLVGTHLIMGLTLEYALTLMVVANAAISIYAIVFHGHLNLKSFRMQELTSLIHFGKYSLTTLAGGNLLKTSDMMIIGYFLGPASAATYAVPLKALELVEIPLRGFVMTTYARLINFYKQGDWYGYRKLIGASIVKLSLLMSPVILICLTLPEFVLKILGGEEYQDAYPILWIIAIAMLLIPADKIVGISLDAIGKPSRNAMKVWVMVVINILGDAFALWLFESLLSVAVITLLNIIAGVMVGVIVNPYFSFSFYKRGLTQKSKASLQKSKPLFT